MATTVTFYVNTASTPGGDGTTNNTTGATRAFAELVDAEAALQRNLVTSDEVLIVECSGTAADPSAVTFSGWTGDATRYLEVRGNNTTGKWDSTKYRLSTNNATNSLLVSGAYYARFRNLQIEVTRTSGTTQFSLFRVSAIAGTNNVDLRVDSCILRVATFGTATGNTFGFDNRLAGSGQKAYYTNNVAYGFDNTNGGNEYAFIAFGTSSSASIYWYNNTADASTGAFQVSSGSASTVTAINNIGLGGGFTGSALAASSYNASENSTATGTGAITNATFTFVDKANGDLHLASGDASGAKTGGTNLTADANYPFSTDIDGHTRPSGSTAWSIGSDEYNSGGASGIDGTFSGSIPLTGSLTGSVEVNGSLAQSIALALLGTASVEVTGLLAGFIPLAGTLTATTTEGGNITGTLTAQIPLALAATASVELQGALNGVVPIVLTGVGSIENRAALAAQIPLAGSGTASVEDRAVLDGIIPIAFVGSGFTTAQDEINGTLAGTITINFSGEVVQYLAAQGSSMLFQRQRERARRFVEIETEQQERLTDNITVVPKRGMPAKATMPVPPEFAQENDAEMIALLYATYTNFFES